MRKNSYLFVLGMALLTLTASADPVEIDGMYYNLVTKAKLAEVTWSPLKYSGDVVIPEKVEHNGTTYSVTSIMQYAFQDCEQMTSVAIPASVTSIGCSAFENCTGLTAVLITDMAAWCAMLFEEDPISYIKNPFTSNPLYYARHLLLNGEEVTNLTVPDGVKSIADRAFIGFDGLTSVTLPSSVKTIGSDAFSDCYSLTSVNTGDGVTAISDRAFYGCTSLNKIVFGKKVTTIGNMSFCRCSSLTSLDFPDNVRIIGGSAFEECSSLSSVNLGNGVRTISDKAFWGCKPLTSITIPKSVVTIGWDAFTWHSLATVNISDLEAWCKIDFGSTLLSSTSHLYLNGEEIYNLVIPASVTEIKDNAFYYCNSLTSVVIHGGVTDIGEAAFTSCGSLASVTLSEGLKKIGEHAFSSCKELSNISIPNSVWSIGRMAFAGCGLTTMAIGSGTSSIAESAFYGNSELADVYCYAKDVPQTNVSAFGGCYPEYATLHVPSESIDAYKAAKPWNSFMAIVSLESQGVKDAEVMDSEHKNDSPAAFDLQGRRIEPSAFNSQSATRRKGISIRNGKKVLSK